MAMQRATLFVFLAALLPGCGTYFDPSDSYVRGWRFFDRRNFDSARGQWEPLANSGDCDAQYRMGTLFFLGTGVPKDFDIAYQWWSTAANRGQAFAQALLGIMHAQDVMVLKAGESESWFNCRTQQCGLEKDTVVAYQWMRLAEKATPYEAFRKLTHVYSEKYQRSLSADQLVKAGQYLQDWKPTPDQCEQRKIR
jgi:TPR repeat protein